MKVVVALGGTALAKRGEALETDVQRQNVARAAAAVAAIARTHEVIVTHGNSPQVGLLAMMAESYAGVHPYPLDVLVAESEGMIGYLIEQELRNLLPGRHIATLLLLTDVGSVYTNWKQKDAQPIHETSSKELRNHTFAAGSMRPKVEAACRFIETGGAFAGIGLLEDAAAILLGRRGTIVRRPESTLDFTGGPQAMPKQAAAAGGKKRGKTATIVARFSAGGSRGIARGCVTRAEPRMPLPRAWIRPNTAATTSSSAARARTISKICRWICRSMN